MHSRVYLNVGNLVDCLLIIHHIGTGGWLELLIRQFVLTPVLGRLMTWNGCFRVLMGRLGELGVSVRQLFNPLSDMSLSWLWNWPALALPDSQVTTVSRDRRADSFVSPALNVLINDIVIRLVVLPSYDALGRRLLLWDTREHACCTVFTKEGFPQFVI